MGGVDDGRECFGVGMRRCQLPQVSARVSDAGPV